MPLATTLTFLLLTMPRAKKVQLPTATTVIRPIGLVAPFGSLALVFRGNNQLADLLCDSTDRCGTFLWNVADTTQPVSLQGTLIALPYGRNLPAFDATATREVDRSSPLLAQEKGFLPNYDQAYLSADSRLLLVVRPARKVSVFKSISSYAVAIGTLGVGVEDEPPNEAIVSVVDTVTNRQCFHTVRKDTGQQMIPRAAISPDGRSIALALLNGIEIFDISAFCTRQP